MYDFRSRGLEQLIFFFQSVKLLSVPIFE